MLEDLTKPNNKRPCRTRSVLWSLNPNDFEILSNAIKDPAWSARTLSLSLRHLGITLSRDSIERHREKLCSCSQSGESI